MRPRSAAAPHAARPRLHAAARRAIAGALLTALACAPNGSAEAPQQPRERAPTDEPSARPPELAGVLQPWHPYDPAWAAADSVWLVTRYTPGTYPCRPGPDGSLDMLLQDRFTILNALRGRVAAPGVDLDLGSLRGPAYPRGWAEERRYLLVLRPGPREQALLADPDALGGAGDRIGGAVVLAAVDLDASADELAAEATPAQRRGSHAGWDFDAARWSSLRDAAAPGPAEQRALAAFLQAEVLHRDAALADVRAWLGPPDRQQLDARGGRRDEYILARPAYVAPAEGAIYGALELGFDARLRLRRAALKYLRWKVAPTVRSSTALTSAEHAAAGLPAFTFAWD